MKNVLKLSLLLAFFAFGCEPNTTNNVLAQCINSSGTKFYGAYWCPHCKEQKEEFGDSASLLPYIECDINGKNSQAELCQQEKITNYPTWKFPDGSVETGVLTLEELSERTSCPLPGEESVMMQTGTN